jgi:hypothetical protein
MTEREYLASYARNLRTFDPAPASPLDLVGNIVGLNSLNPFKAVGSLVAAPSLFTRFSPHSGYP